MRYINETFDVQTFEQAKNVVLSTDDRDPGKFDRETDYLIDTMNIELDINQNSIILDFGCGMGRVSKKLIDKFKCTVIGTDLSESMRTFAMIYVSQPRKFFLSRDYINPNSIDIALCSLVLQHVENPEYEIKNIVDNIKYNGYLVLLNEKKRMVPLKIDNQGYIDWVDDKFDIFAEIEKYMEKTKVIPYINKDKDIVIYRKSK